MGKLPFFVTPAQAGAQLWCAARVRTRIGHRHRATTFAREDAARSGRLHFPAPARYTRLSAPVGDRP